MRYAAPDEWNNYKADETTTKRMNYFGKLLEKFTPLLVALGFCYRVYKKVNNTDC